MNVILIGYMGCGKTTVGKNLAKLCRYTFLDTDEEIEKEQGCTISELFQTQGESAFREMETAYLRRLLREKADGLVISTGGGMPLREENHKLLQELGLVVYLQVRPDTVYERVKDDTRRPLLQCDDPRGKIVSMLQQRTPVYEKAAQVTIAADRLRQYEIAEKIREKIVQ